MERMPDQAWRKTRRRMTLRIDADIADKLESMADNHKTLNLVVNEILREALGG